MDKEKIEQLLQNENFLTELDGKNTPEEAQAVFAGRGVEISINQLMAMKIAAKQGSGEELDDDELGHVAGGVSPGHVINTVIDFKIDTTRRVVNILRRW